MNCIKQYFYQVISIRKCLRNIPVGFLWVQRERVEFQSIFENHTFGRFFYIFLKMTLKFIPSQSDHVFNLNEFTLVRIHAKTTVFMPFYDFIVKFQKLAWQTCLHYTEKRMNHRQLPMVLYCRQQAPLVNLKQFGVFNNAPVVHNYENLEISKNRPIGALHSKKGLSLTSTTIPQKCPQMLFTWNRLLFHTFPVPGWK